MQDKPSVQDAERAPSGLAALRLAPDQGVSVTDRVHRLLRQAIIGVQLAPGTPISENSLSQQLSISRSPVRAAIQRLAEEGLVEVSPQRGSYVAALHMDQMHDSHFVRRSLELALLHETAQLWTPEMTAQLRAVIADQERAVNARDADLFLTLDETFHRTLAELSGRKGVWAAIQAPYTALGRFHHYWAKMDRLADVLREHRAIIAALEQGDGDAAKAALATHLDMVFVILDRMPEERRKQLPF
ncbi:HTH-type transcriptional repressor RspR [Roseobacter fucihabitans]|uniref:HTH-type transcriptional repressor RspR n=1 Tax=Roseobacter fucihabitans TaxID=1537242 RepID=A0ABZ2BMJ7_9RHOB|nr:GntR family transcriptional regulator [Roseobacter litoralis]MBC6963610.1 putative HTH-type transcriptional regulator YdfH [Roseobacter litoralis]